MQYNQEFSLVGLCAIRDVELMEIGQSEAGTICLRTSGWVPVHPKVQQSYCVFVEFM